MAGLCTKIEILAETGHVLALRDISLEVYSGEFAQVGQGFETGISVLFMAIIIDRSTHAFAEHEYESRNNSTE